MEICGDSGACLLNSQELKLYPRDSNTGIATCGETTQADERKSRQELLNAATIGDDTRGGKGTRQPRPSGSLRVQGQVDVIDKIPRHPSASVCWQEFQSNTL